MLIPRTGVVKFAGRQLNGAKCGQRGRGVRGGEAGGVYEIKSNCQRRTKGGDRKELGIPGQSPSAWT